MSKKADKKGWECPKQDAETTIRKGKELAGQIIAEVSKYHPEDARVMLFIVRKDLQDYLETQSQEILKHHGLLK